ncbi:uncharacterized protein LOC133189861 [Saccostrea echinata]|uniref:uncharacterized protein LOC133189861 n=1 Tax=Saccostrea echinata TaxID=191078 RepID=UPI002A835232|nr:uncharacterized protein LOC133189861 [Saccostrea echinata]
MAECAREQPIEEESVSISCSESSSVSSRTSSSRSEGLRKYKLTSSDEPTQIFKKNVSKWKQVDLDALGIFYDQAALPLSTLIARTKQVAWRGQMYRMTTTPDHLHTFEEIMKESITLTLPYETGPRPVTSVEAVTLVAEIEETREKFFDYSMQVKEKLNLSKEKEKEFLLWQSRTHDFLKFLGKFQEIRTSCPVRESQYTNLFMKFSEIFSLQPELGDNRKAHISIGKQEVVSIPDLRFIRYPKHTLGTLLVMLTEVKVGGVGDEWRNELPDAFDIHMLSTHILGQHGGELLAERHYSFFTPGVLGVICLKTKLIITFMEMTEDHYKCIEKGLSCDEKRASISYTKPYDYWNAKDREEIYETLFWLGHLQSSEK